MAPTFLPAVDVSSPQSAGSLSLQQLSYVGSVYAKVSSDEVNAATAFVKSNFGRFDVFFDVTPLDSLDHIVALLDAGATAVLASPKQIELLAAVDNLDPSRVVYVVESAASADFEAACQSVDGAVYSPKAPEPTTLSMIIANRKHEAGPVFVNVGAADSNTVLEVAEAGALPVVPVSCLTMDAKPEANHIAVADVLMAQAKTDRPDGLFTTLVTDERGIALGLVYSSKESVAESLRTGRGVYQSRKRGLWYKGDSSGDIQELVNVVFDCDQDCLCFTVRQIGRGFCHLGTATCMGGYRGLSRLQKTLQARKDSAPPGSYTARLFNEPKLLSAKIKEEADELCDATSKDHIAFEAADLLYFALTKCVASGVSLADVERSLDQKSVKVKRRKGDAKPQYTAQTNGHAPTKEEVKEAASVPKAPADPAGLDASGRIRMTRYVTAQCTPETVTESLKRPSQRSTEKIMGIVKPIVDDVQKGGDKALLSYTHKFEKATSLTSPVVHAPFPEHLMQVSPETAKAIDISFENIRRFHAAQQDSGPLNVETMPGVVCSRFSRPIERVGLYVPGGTAVLPSTALMLGVPAMVAGCKTIVLATPPRADGSVTPEVIYVAHKIGAASVVLAGGAQAVAAMAYGTQSISKVDKILGPGNQFVTAAKMLVANDTSANVAIDMPAGPSEVLVIADKTSNPAFVAADLLSQAEHGVDSQVVLIAIGMDEAGLTAIEDELHAQASALPRVDIVRGAIEHSVTLVVRDEAEAMALSNEYAPEHLIIQTADAPHAASLVENAGSVFIGPWTPESVGDYSAGVNHSLPTYGYARQYSGVNLGSYIKHITSSQLTADGLRNVGDAVMQLAKVEQLEAHRRAVSIRLEHMRNGAGVAA